MCQPEVQTSIFQLKVKMNQSKSDQLGPSEERGTTFLNSSIYSRCSICFCCPTNIPGSSFVLVGTAHPSLTTAILQFTVLLRWQTFLQWCSNTAVAHCSHCSQISSLLTVATVIYGLTSLCWSKLPGGFPVSYKRLF